MIEDRALLCPGNLASVAAHGTRIYVAAKNNQTQEMCLSLQDGAGFVVQHRFKMGSAGAGFPSLASHATGLWLGYIPSNGDRAIVINLSTGERREHEGRVETWAIVLGANGYGICFNDTAHARWVSKTYSYLDGTKPVKELIGVGAGTGLASVADDLLTVMTADVNRAQELTAFGVLNPDYDETGIAFTGEGHTNGGIPIVYRHEQKIVLFPGSSSHVMPKITRNGEEWAVVSSDYETLTLIPDITRDELIGATPPVPQPPTGRVFELEGGPVNIGDIIRILK